MSTEIEVNNCFVILVLFKNEKNFSFKNENFATFT